jgi:hypothetical protein
LNLVKALFLNFVATVKEMQRLYTDIIKGKKNFLRKDAPKQADFEELSYDDKTTIYTKTALVKYHAFIERNCYKPV